MEGCGRRHLIYRAPSALITAGDPGADWGRRGRFLELIGVALGDSLALVNRTTDGSVCVNESSEAPSAESRASQLLAEILCESHSFSVARWVSTPTF